MLKTLFNLMFNRELIRQQDSLFGDKDIIIHTNLQDNPLYPAYLSVWSIKTYFVGVYGSWKQIFKNIRVGNIYNSLMGLLQSFVIILHNVNYNLDRSRVNMVDAYEVLSTEHLIS